MRELGFFGPKRYTDLLDGLPGIAPNVLASRLKEMESAGLVARRRLPPPAASTVYDLTEKGAGLTPVLVELYRFGMQLLGPPRPTDHLRLSWVKGVMQGRFRRDRAADLAETYEFRIDDEVFFTAIKKGRVHFGDGPATAPDLVVQCDLETFVAVASRQVDIKQAQKSGALLVEGKRGAADRWLELLGLPAAVKA